MITSGSCGKACTSLSSAFSSWRRWREVRKPLALQSFPLEAPSLPGLNEQLTERSLCSSPASLFLALKRADIPSHVFFWGEPWLPPHPIHPRGTGRRAKLLPWGNWDSSGLAPLAASFPHTLGCRAERLSLRGSMAAGFLCMAGFLSRAFPPPNHKDITVLG